MPECIINLLIEVNMLSPKDLRFFGGVGKCDRSFSREFAGLLQGIFADSLFLL